MILQIKLYIQVIHIHTGGIVASLSPLPFKNKQSMSFSDEYLPASIRGQMDDYLALAQGKLGKKVAETFVKLKPLIYNKDGSINEAVRKEIQGMLPEKYKVNGKSVLSTLHFESNTVYDASLYHRCPESYPDLNVPKGTINPHIGCTLSKVEPLSNTQDNYIVGPNRNRWTYIPAGLKEMDPNIKPGLLIFNDGERYMDPEGQINVPGVLDTLIHNKTIPPTIAVFIEHGDFAQRLWETGSLCDSYAQMLLTKVIPNVEKEIGRKLTSDPKKKFIGGFSSSAACAVNIAYNHPDVFGGAISHCGGFVCLESGNLHEIPLKFRMTPRKDIKIFMTTGENDASPPGGDLRIMNLLMANCLKYAGYTFRFEYGMGSHNLSHAGSLFADTLNWMFNDNSPVGSASGSGMSKL